jgi:transketolase
MFAAHHEISNLVAIIDYNKIQSLDTISSTLALEPFRDKWEAFGWVVTEVDGHNHDEIRLAIDEVSNKKNSPLLVLAHTTKGKGVSFMEDTVLWHYRSPQNEEFTSAISELSGGQ